MKRGFFGIVVLVVLSLTAFLLAVGVGRAQLAQVSDLDLPKRPAPAPVIQLQSPTEPVPSTACALQPDPPGKSPKRITRSQIKSSLGAVSLSRFRQEPTLETSTDPAGVVNMRQTLLPQNPPEEIALIDPTNYGDRYLRDIKGNPALLEPIVVLHETVGSANSVINYFRTPHPRDEDQVSYHTLIRLDGTVVYLVPPDKRAYGAGNSAFRGPNGWETVRTKPNFPGSVNNFAYHISLESPRDGYGNSYGHSGYTEAQYRSLAWLVAKTGIPDDRITTHKDVDRSGSRMDPRSFRFDKFRALLASYPRTTEISLRCTDPPALTSTAKTAAKTAGKRKAATKSAKSTQ